MDFLSESDLKMIVVLVLPLILAFACYKVKLLTSDGAIASVAVGYFIGLTSSLEWLLILLLFTIIGFGVTLYRLGKKKEQNLQEGTNGERTWKNVLGVSVPCCLFSAISMMFDASSMEYLYVTVGYVSTVAVAAADTTASEVGVKDPDVWMITTMQRTKPGVDGGISATGTAMSLLAATVTGLFAWALLFHHIDAYILIVILAGFVGCMLDSVIGATWEKKGYVNKYTNNCITGIVGGLIGTLLVMVC